jgi:hypothetical protein
MPDDAPPRTPARPSGPPIAPRPAPAARPGDARAPDPARPPVTPAERERGRIVGLAALGAASVVAVVVTIGIFIPALGAVFSNAPSPVDAADLPATITVCDVEYAQVSAIPEALDAARVRASGAEPIVVGVSGTCPEGVCVRNGACLDVVFVKTTDDRFAPYDVADESEAS